MQTAYSRVARFWNLGMILCGWNSGLKRYIKRLPVTLPAQPKILDIGCGPGILSFALLKKFPDAEIIAADIDEIMLQETERIARKNRISPTSLIIAQSDVNCPNQLTLQNGELKCIEPGYFDLIVAGGILEHAETSIAIPALTTMLKPEGFFLIIGMDENSWIGKIYEVIYKICLIPRDYLFKELSELKYQKVTVLPLGAKDFPANLSRAGFIAQK